MKFKLTSSFHKKANMSLETMSGLALFLVMTIVLVSIGAQIVQETNSNVPDNSTADNVSTLGNQAFQQFAELGTTLGIVTVAVVIIGLLKFLK